MDTLRERLIHTFSTERLGEPITLTAIDTSLDYIVIDLKQEVFVDDE